jgi:hypothetical protein
MDVCEVLAVWAVRRSLRPASFANTTIESSVNALRFSDCTNREDLFPGNGQSELKTLTYAELVNLTGTGR